MKNLVKLLFVLFALLPGLLSCSGNDAIPKLVPIEAFESGERVESLGDAVVFTTPKVDILFVIDNSGSMNAFQNRLAANIDLFLQELARVDRLSYQVAVVTSGDTNTPHSSRTSGNMPSYAQLGRFFKKEITEPDFITPSTPNGLEMLKTRLMPGTNGAAQEVFFESALNALLDPYQADFVRDDAHLAIVFVTDAEDVSTTVTKDTLLQGLRSIKDPDKLVLAYGALIPSELSADELATRNSCRRDDQGPPVNIEAFIDELGGRMFDICSEEFGQELAKVGRDLSESIGQSSVLDEVPDPSTIRVFAGDYEIPNHPLRGWVYMAETNELIFGNDIHLDDSIADKPIQVMYTRATNFRQ